jgi:hypothetical protein
MAQTGYPEGGYDKNVQRSRLIVQNANGGKERWMELCEQAANEQDPKRLNVLVAAIIDALDAKQKRLSYLPSNNILDSPAKPLNPQK